ncbi:Crp/Fnr family transcriptional regulator [Acuticoccus kandeliae]|uniref:Crp/Fnr family transcriptional regulator n=1 Tax=Acuticoccus kandeliae TaxID=2073160 RepID=UPI001472ECBD|nr:Crp/Fnr family transcriptional regulator [Acuticoccus kandeliae]
MSIQSAFNLAPLPSACSRCAIRSQSLCGALTDVALSALNGISRHRHFAPGQIVVTEGEPAIFANVVSGILVEKKGLADGREQIVAMLFPADFIGDAQRDSSDTTVQAVTAVTMCAFDRQGFEHLLVHHPVLAHCVLDHAMARLENAREWMLLLGQKSAEERVATFLLRLALRQADAGCRHVAPDMLEPGLELEIPISRAQMAAYLGLTIETVSRRMTALRDAGLVAFRDARSIRLVNLEALRKAAGDQDRN